MEMPTTWTLDADKVERLWKDTREVFGNKLWDEDMYGIFPADWREQAQRRSGKHFSDLLREAVGGFGGGRSTDPSLIFLALQRTFAQYGVTLEFADHRVHGDLIERAHELE